MQQANRELAKAEEWFNCNKLTINAKTSKYILFKHPESHVHVSNLYIGNSSITRVGSTCTEKSVRFLGIWIDEQLSFSGHIDKLKSKLNSGLYALSTCNKFVPLQNVKISTVVYLKAIYDLDPL